MHCPYKNCTDVECKLASALRKLASTRAGCKANFYLCPVYRIKIRHALREGSAPVRFAC